MIRHKIASFVAVVPRRACINGAVFLLRHIRRDLRIAKILDEAGNVASLVGTQSSPAKTSLQENIFSGAIYRYIICCRIAFLFYQLTLAI